MYMSLTDYLSKYTISGIHQDLQMLNLAQTSLSDQHAAVVETDVPEVNQGRDEFTGEYAV
jgi:hypothetical protein